jgi:hypothetical protein
MFILLLFMFQHALSRSLQENVSLEKLKIFTYLFCAMQYSLIKKIILAAYYKSFQKKLTLSVDIDFIIVI